MFGTAAARPRSPKRATDNLEVNIFVSLGVIGRRLRLAISNREGVTVSDDDGDDNGSKE